MEIACRFPGVGGAAARPVVVRVHVEPGQPVSIGNPILDVTVNDAAFTVVANVQGTIREVRLRPGDSVAPGRVILWVDSPRESLTDDSSSLGSARLIPRGAADSAPAPAQADAPWTPEAFPAAETLAALNGRLDRLVELLQQVSQVHQALGLHAGQDLIDQEIQRLRTDRFTVAIVGEFKRGKSTLVNALMGEQLLPSDPLPCSAALIRVTYGAARRARILYREGEEENVPVERLREFGTKLTPEFEAKAAGVSEILLECPLDLCRARVDIIDTPGLNDEAAMTEVTLSVLPQVDAALLVMAPESPFSITERRFLIERLLQADIGRVILVVNAMDRINEQDRDRLLAGIRRRVEKELTARLSGAAPAFELLGVSSAAELRGNGMHSGFAELRGALESLLIRDRGAIVTRRAVHRFGQSAQDALAAIRMRLAANAMNVRERETSIRSLALALSEIRGRAHALRVADEAQSGIEDDVRTVASNLYAALLAKSAEILDGFGIDIDTLDKDSAGEICRKLNEELAACVSAEATQHLETLAEHIRRAYDKQAVRLNAFLRQSATAVRGEAGDTDRIAPFSTETWKRVFQRNERTIRGGGFAGVLFTLRNCAVAPNWSLALSYLGRGQADDLLRPVRLRAVAEFRKKCKAQFQQSVNENASPAVLYASMRRIARLPFLELSDIFEKELAVTLRDFENTYRALQQENEAQEAYAAREAERLSGCRAQILQAMDALAKAAVSPEPITCPPVAARDASDSST